MEDTKYLPELLAEKDSLDSSFTHAMKLISAGKGEFGRLSARRGWQRLAPQHGVRPVGYNVVVGDCWMNPLHGLKLHGGVYKYTANAMKTFGLEY